MYEKVDSVVTDPPYGISTSTGDIEGDDIFKEFFHAIYDNMKDDAYLCMASPHYVDLEPMVAEVGFEIVEQYGKRSIDEINYLFNNLSLANTFESVDAFFEYVEQSFQQQNRKGNVIKADVELKDKTFNLMEKASKEDLVGGDAKENAKITLAILNGEKGPKRNAVLLNSAAGLYVAGEVDSLREGVELAEEIIDSGKALKQLERFIEITNS